MNMLLIRNGLIHDLEQKEPYYGDILVKDGKIAAVGTDLTDDAEVFEAEGKDVYPGMIDAHSHLGVSGTGIGFEGSDYNELGDINSPQVRGIDSVNPFDPAFKTAARAGITTIATGPGSANALGGTWLAIKTTGICVDDMVVRDPVAMKCAFGENPKRCYKDRGNFARMSTAAHLREMLFKAREYMAKKDLAGDDLSKMPPFDFKMESLLPVMRKEIPLKAHAHQANDILTAVRIAREFDLKMTLEHVTEGHLIADVLAKTDYPMAVGPTFTDASKFELQYKSWTTPGILAAKGCLVSLITDHPFSLEEYLPMYAGLAVKAGMDPYEALKAITINPAKHLGIEDRVGSIKAGKDADIMVYEGPLFAADTSPKAVFINGELIR